MQARGDPPLKKDNSLPILGEYEWRQSANIRDTVGETHLQTKQGSANAGKEGPSEKIIPYQLQWSKKLSKLSGHLLSKLSCCIMSHTSY